MRNTTQSLRTKIRGSDPKLHPRILWPAAPLLHRLPAAERSRQVEIQVGDRDLQGAGDGEQPLGRDVFESTLERREVGRRQLRGLRQLAQGPLGFLTPAAEQGAECDSNRACVFAVGVLNMR